LLPGLVLDTHATIWYLEASPRLSARALAAIQTALTAAEPIHVSTLTIVELTDLVEKGRFPVAFLDRLLVELRRQAPELVVTPMDLATAEVVRTISGTVIRDMPDRIIAATAVSLGLPLVTRDQHIQSSGITVIW
jgi:PIN domain nuclease of toxin-antitoxin system